MVCARRRADAWARAYTRETAAYPTARLRKRKFGTSVGRIDGACEDRDFICSRAGLEC
ncbi:MAG: hypothetical protein HKL90_04390 [Elusimicrobia bacterium]|nr:hypothetical protein [Elusimicrobiota bacterium]